MQIARYTDSARNRSVNRSANRSGATLIEALIALTLLGAVCATALTAFVTQLRSHRRAVERMELHDQLREAATILAAELRNLSSASGDILPGGAQRHTIEFLSTVGYSTVCAVPDPARLHLAPSASAGSSAPLALWQGNPAAGNRITLLISDPGDSSLYWENQTVAATATVTNPCSGTPFAESLTPASRGYVVTLASPASSQVVAGTHAVVLERVRYTLYQSSDSKWYLGSCNSASVQTPCATLQPLAGPFLPAASGAPGAPPGGVELRYYDKHGVETASPTQITGIQIAVRGVPRSQLLASGGPSPGAQPDSVIVFVRVTG